MSETKEIEALGFIDKDKFNKLRKTFTNKFGKPKEVKRLSISFWDPSINKNLDTRIRITNGKPEVMQKYGDWENLGHMNVKELSLKLPRDTDQIFIAYKILYNNIVQDLPPRLIQYQNLVYDQPDFEVKLMKQFGKSEKYLFEVELKDNKKDLEKILKRLRLTKYIKKTDSDFWLRWNRKINLSTDSLSEGKMEKLIKKYINF